MPVLQTGCSPFEAYAYADTPCELVTWGMSFLQLCVRIPPKTYCVRGFALQSVMQVLSDSMWKRRGRMSYQALSWRKI